MDKKQKETDWKKVLKHLEQQAQFSELKKRARTEKEASQAARLRNLGGIPSEPRWKGVLAYWEEGRAYCARRLREIKKALPELSPPPADSKDQQPGLVRQGSLFKLMGATTALVLLAFFMMEYAPRHDLETAGIFSDNLVVPHSKIRGRTGGPFYILKPADHERDGEHLDSRESSRETPAQADGSDPARPPTGSRGGVASGFLEQLKKPQRLVRSLLSALSGRGKKRTGSGLGSGSLSSGAPSHAASTSAEVFGVSSAPGASGSRSLLVSRPSALVGETDRSVFGGPRTLSGQRGASRDASPGAGSGSQKSSLAAESSISGPDSPTPIAPAGLGFQPGRPGSGSPNAGSSGGGGSPAEAGAGGAAVEYCSNPSLLELKITAQRAALGEQTSLLHDSPARAGAEFLRTMARNSKQPLMNAETPLQALSAVAAADAEFFAPKFPDAAGELRQLAQSLPALLSSIRQTLDDLIAAESGLSLLIAQANMPQDLEQSALTHSRASQGFVGYNQLLSSLAQIRARHAEKTRSLASVLEAILNGFGEGRKGKDMGFAEKGLARLANQERLLSEAQAALPASPWDTLSPLTRQDVEGYGALLKERREKTLKIRTDVLALKLPTDEATPLNQSLVAAMGFMAEAEKHWVSLRSDPSALKPLSGTSGSENTLLALPQLRAASSVLRRAGDLVSKCTNKVNLEKIEPPAAAPPPPSSGT